jgi:hypothetical protein
MKRTMWLATLDTRNFHFEAIDIGKSLAWSALVQGLKEHGRQYRCDPDWFAEYLDDINVRAIDCGVCHRDGEPLPMPAPARRAAP